MSVDRGRPEGAGPRQSDAIDSSLWITTEEGQVKLDRSDILHGYPAKKIRDFLGHGRDGAFSYRDYCEVETFFGVAEDYFGYDAKAVTAELLKRGWIIKGKGRDLKECTEDQNTAIMILTQIGKQSRIVSLNKCFSRQRVRLWLPSWSSARRRSMRVTICSAAFLNCDCMAACLIQMSRRSVMWMSRMSFSTSSRHRGSAEANGTLKELSNLVEIFSFVK